MTDTELLKSLCIAAKKMRRLQKNFQRASLFDMKKAESEFDKILNEIEKIKNENKANTF